MNIIKPKMVFVGESSIAFVSEAARRVNPDVKIIVLGRVPGFLEFDRIIAEPNIDEVEKFICTPIKSSDEIAAINFSSGTTADPKGVVFSHRALTLLMGQAELLGMTKKVCFEYAATYWITNIEIILTTLWLKIPRILLPPFEENEACAMIQKYRTNWVSVTPYMIDKLVKCDAVVKCDLSSVCDVLYTGNALSTASYRALKKLVPNAQIISVYGMTETAGFISISSSKSQPHSCGEIVENAQVKIIHPDTGRILGVNQKGELLLKFACTMTCYYNDPEATAQIMDEDGWLHSGDIGYYDENGEIFLIDRIKEVLLYDDFEVSSSKLENVILSHPGVKEVAVVGQRQPNHDDLPIAFVVRTENSSYTGDQVTETDIINLFAVALQGSGKQLRAGVRFVDHLPRTPTDKIKRSVLREMAKLTVTD